MKNLCTALLGMLFTGLSVAAQQPQVITDYQVVPKPLKVELTNKGKGFLLKEGTKVTYPSKNENMKRNAEFLATYIKEQTGITLQPIAGKIQNGAINLTLSKDVAQAEGYTLNIEDKRINIAGSTEAGVFYGIQTLRKAIADTHTGSILLSNVKIEDAPRFHYRGMHLDVSRHFFGVEDVKTYIDILAMHNVNRFHWHLTDDQGWRIEIKKYPKLTTVGSMRKETLIGKYGSGVYDGKPHGGFFTQEQAKEIVDYAAKRYITVIPEIDLPGHMQAALASYPELGCLDKSYEVRTTWDISDDVLCAGNPQVLEFIDNVLAEIVEIFPSEYIHIGGDECPKIRWERCPKCQAKIKELGLKSDNAHTKEERLQSYLISTTEQMLAKRGRKLIGWSEILEGGLAPNATLMSWLGESGGIQAARMGHDVIMSPNNELYFDHYQSQDTDNEPLGIGGFTPIEEVYYYEPVPAALTSEEEKYIIGVQANMWTEYIATFSHVQYMLLPRLAALAEVQWTPRNTKDFSGFLARMPRLLNLYNKYGWSVSGHIYDVKAEVKPGKEEGTVAVSVTTMPGAKVYYSLNGSTPFRGSEDTYEYTGPFTIQKGARVLRMYAEYPDKTTRVVGYHLPFKM